ncbi:hypothetical protein B0H11DRAFT_1660268, partial [Mycena galericulata]
LGDDRADGIQVVPPDEYDTFFGDGSDMDVDLPDDAALNSKEARAVKMVNEKLAELCIGHCSECREEGFDVKMKDLLQCTRCWADKSDTKLWSDENNTNPTPGNMIPPCLQYLTDMEEMLIARTKTVMQVRWTKG